MKRDKQGMYRLGYIQSTSHLCQISPMKSRIIHNKYTLIQELLIVKRNVHDICGPREEVRLSNCLLHRPSSENVDTTGKPGQELAASRKQPAAGAKAMAGFIFK